MVAISKNILLGLACLASTWAQQETPSGPVVQLQLNRELNPAVPEDALGLFLFNAIKRAAPWAPGAAEAFDDVFAPDLRSRYNNTLSDFSGLQAFFTAAGGRISGSFSEVAENITSLRASVDPANPLQGTVNIHSRLGGILKTGEERIIENGAVGFIRVNNETQTQQVFEWYELTAAALI